MLNEFFFSDRYIFKDYSMPLNKKIFFYILTVICDACAVHTFLLVIHELTSNIINCTLN